MTTNMIPAVGAYRATTSMEPYRATRLVSLIVVIQEVEVDGVPSRAPTEGWGSGWKSGVTHQ